MELSDWNKIKDGSIIISPRKNIERAVESVQYKDGSVYKIRLAMINTGGYYAKHGNAVAFYKFSNLPKGYKLKETL